MHILHVTPHLPPDQAANALLPWHLGNWSHEAGDEVEYVAHPPRVTGGAAARRARDLGAAPVASTLIESVALIGSSLASLRVWRALAPQIERADVVHAHSNGLLAELAVLLARRARQAGRS